MIIGEVIGNLVFDYFENKIEELNDYITSDLNRQDILDSIYLDRAKLVTTGGRWCIHLTNDAFRKCFRFLRAEPTNVIEGE